jgi:anti-sigma regulatory factor (Ser/Thr protein kinase)
MRATVSPVSSLPPQAEPTAGFRHEALFYSGEEEFVAAAAAFIRAARADDAATLVVVSARKIERLCEELGDEADDVRFADMVDVGSNPARIIPAWREFVDEHGGTGRPLRGIGEPIWAGRGDAEVVECQHHESLLNLAFADVPDFELLCPYDTEVLDRAVLDEACCSHPVVVDRGGRRVSDSCRPLDEVAAPFDAPLPAPPARPHELAFDHQSLAAVRSFVSVHASVAGMGELGAEDIALAVHELATNSLRHGGGRGVVRLWTQDGSLVCEVADRGSFRPRPLVGRERPHEAQIGGFGVWLANQLCDLVQLRAGPEGTVVRAHMRLP